MLPRLPNLREAPRWNTTPWMNRPILSTLRRLAREEAGPHRASYFAALAFVITIAVTTALPAWLMKDVINRIFVDKNEAATWWLGAAIIVIFTVKGLATYGQQVTLSAIGNRIVASVQMRMFNHLLEQGQPFFAQSHSTQLIAQQSFIANCARDALNLIITAMGRDVLSLIGLVAVMFFNDPVMAAGALVVMPVALVGVRSLIRRVKKIVTREFASLKDIMRTISETAQGIKVVKAFQLEDYMRLRMQKSVGDFTRAALRINRISARSAPMMETLGGFAVAFVVVYGGYRVINGGQTQGAYFSFIASMLWAYEPAKRLAKFNIDLNAHMAGVNMMYDFLDSGAAESDDSSKPPLVISKGEITFENVSFAYRPEDPVLDKISFIAQGGRNTALIGPSGSGKTTIFSLIQRFYIPVSGRILIDGQDISALTRASLRHNIATVSQDTFLFQGTIRENIALGRPDASEAEIIAACKAAHVDDFVSEFAEGYEAAVGEHGHALSGGQRQRVAIARAILKDAPIVLLDEATSALDTTSELFVREGLQTLCAGRTVLLIAHRKETYAHADDIIAIDSGRILQAA